MRAKTQSRALLVLIAIFAGALLLATDSFAEGFHLGGRPSGKSSARGAKGTLAEQCAPVRPPTTAPALPAPTVAPPPADPVRIARNTPSERGIEDSSKPGAKAAAGTRGVKDADQSGKTGTPQDEETAKPSAEEIAKLGPEAKIPAILKTNGCIGCHKPNSAGRELFKDNGKFVSNEARAEIAKMLLGKTDVPSEMTAAVTAAKKDLASADTDLLREWAKNN